MAKKRAIVLAIGLGSLLISACSHKDMAVSKNVISFKKMNESILSEYRASPEEEGTFYYQRIVLEDGDFDNISYLTERELHSVVTIDARGMSLKTFLRALQEYLSNTNIVYSLADDSSLDKKLNLSFKNDTVYDILKVVEKVGDVDIEIHGTTMYVKDRISIQGSLSSSLSGTTQSVTNKVMDNISKNLKEILGKDAKIVVDKDTGAYYVSSSPNDMRKGRLHIENILNQASAHSLLTFNIYKIDNKKNREYGLNTELLIDQITKISTGSSALSTTPLYSLILDRTQGGTVDPKGLLTLSIKALEDLGIVHSVVSSRIMIFNGMLTDIKNKKEVGYWIPGEISTSYGGGSGNVNNNSNVPGAQNNTNNSVPYLRENRPEFKKEEVGTELKIIPRIDYKTKTANINIEYEESEVYSYEETTWKRDQNSQAIVLKKPLKTTNSFNSRVILEDGKFKVVSGSRQKEANFKDSYIPGVTALGTHRNKTVFRDVFIVTKVKFPQKTQEIIISKKEE